MNEAEKRRKRLLEETRRKYSETRIPPAVHPRYNTIYSDLYRSGEEKTGGAGGLGVRLVVAVLLFAAFIAMDDQKVKVASVDSSRIVTEIEKVSIPYLNDFTIW